MIMRDMHLCINGVTRNSDQKSGFGDGLETVWRVMMMFHQKMT